MSPIRTSAMSAALAACLLALPAHTEELAPATTRIDRTGFVEEAMIRLAQPASDAEAAPANPLIDYDGFVELAAKLGDYREQRRLAWDEFAARALADGAILLDARSETAFAQGHIEGAINLPLPDFTADRLAEVLGTDKDRPVFIYCNNNFADDRPPVVTKKLELALNIPTFINLVGYGYENVWELAEVISMDDPAVNWAAKGG